MKIVNKPEVSRATSFLYVVLFVFIAALAVFFLFAAYFTPMGEVGVIASLASLLVAAIVLTILASLYRTRYILTDRELIIETTILIGGNKSVPLEAVKSIEKTLMPFGVRLFGASFHGGYYHIPGLGRAFLSITNLSNALLIKTDKRNYIITPNRPLDFKGTMERKIENL
jgi:hypothetical protein